MASNALSLSIWVQRAAGLLQKRGVTGLLTVALFIAAGAYLAANARKLTEYNWQVSPGWLALAGLLIIFVAPLFRVWLWRLVLTRLGANISYRECFRIVRLSQLAKYLPGQVWHYVGTFYLTHKAGATKGASVSTMLYDQGASFAAGALVVIALAAASDALAGYGALWFVAVASLGIGVVFLRPSLFSKTSGIVLKVLKKQPFSGLPTTSVPFTLLLVVMNVAFWFILGGSLSFLIRGVTPVDVPLGDAVVIGAVGVLAGFIAPFAPSGIGVTEGMMVLLLRQYVPLEVALAIALLFRVLNVSKEIVLGLIALRIEGRDKAESGS